MKKCRDRLTVPAAHDIENKWSALQVRTELKATALVVLVGDTSHSSVANALRLWRVFHG